MIVLIDLSLPTTSITLKLNKNNFLFRTPQQHDMDSFQQSFFIFFIQCDYNNSCTIFARLCDKNGQEFVQRMFPLFYPEDIDVIITIILQS